MDAKMILEKFPTDLQTLVRHGRYKLYQSKTEDGFIATTFNGEVLVFDGAAKFERKVKLTDVNLDDYDQVFASSVEDLVGMIRGI